MNIVLTEALTNKGPGDLIDIREQLFNDGLTGPVGLIQLPTERITRLRGILLDLDPAKFIADNPWFPPADDPRQFHANIRPVLQRHPLARHAETRLSGTGLHPILRLDPPVELTSAAEQKRWATLVRAVQCTLPADPNAPGITALTRAIGSINSKNGAVVELLELGSPVSPEDVIEFVEGLAKAPFRTVAMILLGAEYIRPCPVCRRDGTHLDVLDRMGKCYGRCGHISLARVFDTIFKPIEPAPANVPHN